MKHKSSGQCIMVKIMSRYFSHLYRNQLKIQSLVMVRGLCGIKARFMCISPAYYAVQFSSLSRNKYLTVRAIKNNSQVIKSRVTLNISFGIFLFYMYKVALYLAPE